MERFVIRRPEQSDYRKIEEAIDDLRNMATFGGSAISFTAFLYGLTKTGRLDTLKYLAGQALGGIAKRIIK